MEEKKIKLLELIKDLDFPFLPQESQEHLNRLSEEDLDFLVRVFTEVKEYRRTIDTVANLVDPEGYKKIQEDYYKKMRDFDLEYTVRLSDVLKDSDQKLDELEKINDQKIKNIVEDSTRAAHEVEDLTDNLLTRIKSVYF